MRVKRISSLLLAIVMIFSFFSAGSTVHAEPEDAGKAVFVVFDNSGSMYLNTDSWCKAKYAMEVFASMMDYDTDILRVYTMHDVSIGSKTYSKFDVSSTADIDKIHNMLTLEAEGTPFDQVNNAYKDLKSDSHADKWLVVLTDGVFDDEKDPKGKLNKFTAAMNVAYFGIGSDAKALSGKFLSANARNTDSTTSELINICNAIFKRDEVAMDGDQVSFDVSMKKIIVFAQGKGASIDSVDGKKSIDMVKDSKRTAKYSELDTSAKVANGQPLTTAKVDDSLEGVIATFGDKDIALGSYAIHAKGDVHVYYEPDVTVGMTLTDEKGKEVDTEKGVVDEGEYTVNYSLYDAQTKKPVGESELLGNIDYNAAYTANGKTEKLENGSKIKINAGMKNIDFKIDAEYGKNTRYKVSSDDAQSGFKFKVNEKKDSLKIKVKAQQDYYVLKKLEQGKEIVAEVSLDGNPLTDEQLKQMKVDVAFNNDVDYDISPIPGKSSYAIKLKYKDGDIKKTATGLTKCTVSGKLKDNLGVTRTAQGNCIFSLSKVAKWVPMAISLIILALLILLLIWWLNQKVLPKRFKIVESNMIIGRDHVAGTANLRASGAKKRNGSISVKSPSFDGVQTGATFSLKAIDPRKVKSAKRKALVTKVSAMGSGADNISISAYDYSKGKSGKYVLDGDDDLANTEKKIPYSYEVVITGKCETSSGRKKPFTFTALIKHL